MYRERERLRQKISKLDNALAYWSSSAMISEKKRKLLERLREIERVISIKEESERQERKRRAQEEELKSLISGVTF